MIYSITKRKHTNHPESRASMTVGKSILHHEPTSQFIFSCCKYIYFFRFFCWCGLDERIKALSGDGERAHEYIYNEEESIFQKLGSRPAWRYVCTYMVQIVKWMDWLGFLSAESDEKRNIFYGPFYRSLVLCNLYGTLE